MKISRNLGLAAILAFLISYFLPAYGDEFGYACFRECWAMLSGNLGADLLTGGWFSDLYYSAFVISNLLFIGLAAALFMTQRHRKLSSALSIIVFLHVLSWLVLGIFSEKPSAVAEIRIGYYVWLMAYVLLVAAHLWEKPAGSLQSIPLARSIV